MSEIYRVAHVGDANNQTIMNVTWWRKVDELNLPLSLTHLQEILGIIAARYVANMVPLFNANYTYRRSALVEVNGFDADGNISDPENPKPVLTASRSLLDFVGSGTTGVSASDPLPNTVAAVVHWDTGRYGRRRRGRIKLGPFDEGDSDGNKMTAAVATAISTAADAYRQDVLTTNPVERIVHGVFSVTSLFETAEPGNPWEFLTPSIDYTVQTTWAVQRSRKLKEGTT